MSDHFGCRTAWSNLNATWITACDLEGRKRPRISNHCKPTTSNLENYDHGHPLVLANHDFFWDAQEIVDLSPIFWSVFEKSRLCAFFFLRAANPVARCLLRKGCVTTNLAESCGEAAALYSTGTGALRSGPKYFTGPPKKSTCRDFSVS